MKRHIILAAMLFCSSMSTTLTAQNLTVFRIAGKVEANGKVLKLKDRIPLKTIVKISEEGMLELLDEASAQRYTIKGKDNGVVSGTVEKLSKEKGNSVLKMTERYVAYVKSQMSNDANVSKSKKFTDFATVTRDIVVKEEAEELSKLSPMERYKRKAEQQRQNYEEFRSAAVQRYDEFVRKAWEHYTAMSGVPKPQDENVGPVRYEPKDDTERLTFADVTSFVKKVFKRKPKTTDVQAENVTIDIAPSTEEVIEIAPQIIEEPQPQPLEPVTEVKVEEQKKEMQVKPEFGYMPFQFFGTEMQVRLDETKRVNLGKISPNRVADALKLLSGKEYDNALYDCLQLRKEHNLSDWAYLQMLKTISEQFCGQGTKESVLLTGYFYYKSGYRIRFATDRSSLYLLVASKHRIYNRNYFDLDGYFYYPVDTNAPEDLNICQGKFPEEKSLSLFIPTQQNFNITQSDNRIIKSRKFPDFSIQVSVNKNMMDFYNEYPSSDINNNVLTRWALYANTPLDKLVSEQIYPQIRKQLEGKSEVEKVRRLLDLIQEGLPYAYDDQVWGGDRPFFAEETLYYPGCDCEDRSILLSRLVRDLIGLKVLLVYYPGHLATAIHFNSNVKGDCFKLDEEVYTVCDPTYIGADIGEQMPKMNSDAAKVILLP